jgi:hypothetical protein
MRSLGRPRGRWEYINTLVKEMLFEGSDWIYLAWYKGGLVEGSCEHGDEPLCSVNGEEFLDGLSGSHVLWRFLFHGGSYFVLIALRVSAC